MRNCVLPETSDSQGKGELWASLRVELTQSKTAGVTWQGTGRPGDIQVEVGHPLEGRLGASARSYGGPPGPSQ